MFALPLSWWGLTVHCHTRTSKGRSVHKLKYRLCAAELKSTVGAKERCCTCSTIAPAPRASSAPLSLFSICLLPAADQLLTSFFLSPSLTQSPIPLAQLGTGGGPRFQEKGVSLLQGLWSSSTATHTGMRINGPTNVKKPPGRRPSLWRSNLIGAPLPLFSSLGGFTRSCWMQLTSSLMTFEKDSPAQ